MRNKQFRFKSLIPILFLFSVNLSLFSQNSTLFGYVTDFGTGESLIGVNIYVPSQKLGTVTNEYGFYTLTLKKGTHNVVFSHLSYKSDTISILVSDNTQKNVRLVVSPTMIKGVEIQSAKNENVGRVETSVNSLSSSSIKAIPAMMGEVDLVKALQFLPGVQPVSEGSSNFSVRGGGYDQNLILLDEAPVYSSSHLLGFFSIFNNDVVKDVKLYKGDIPTSFGGRLSSLMEVRTKEGNNRKFGGGGSIGTISSKLMIESPVFTDKVSFSIAGRRTYADLFLRLSNDKDTKESQLYFYDFNANINYKISNSDRIYASVYFGKDQFRNVLAGMNFGNRTATIRWNHIFYSKLFFSLSTYYSNYTYAMLSSISNEISFEWQARLRDIGARLNFTFTPNSNNILKFGYDIAHHTIYPGKGGGRSDSSVIKKFNLPSDFALEHSAYISHQATLWKKVNVRYGVRASMFNNLGNNNYRYNIENHRITDSVYASKNKVVNTNFNIEPRVSVNFSINNKSSVKVSYSRLAQYMQIASNSAAGSPLDLWFFSSKNVKPQISNLIVLGYFHNFFDNMLEFSSEIYYKNFANVVDFKERAQLMANQYLETQLRYGKGYSYGLEVMLNKSKGKLTGWISYTFSRSFRKIEEINNHDWYRSPYDKPHNFSIVANYKFNYRWSVSASWIYSTGTPTTYPEGRYLIDDRYVPIPSKRNAYRMPDFHRLDISALWVISKPDSKFHNELGVSIYNAYARKNPWTIYFVQDKQDPNKTKARMIYLFSIVPSITWNFNF